MDPIILAEMVKSAIALATQLATQAVSQNAMTPQEVQNLWSSARIDWDGNWAAWLQQQSDKLAAKQTKPI